MANEQIEHQKETLGVLARLSLLIEKRPMALLCIFLVIRTYQIESKTDKRMGEMDSRAMANEKFDRDRYKKESEQEDRKLKIRETELNILHAPDSF